MAMKKIYVELSLPYEGETASHTDQYSIPSEFKFSWKVHAQLWRSADMLSLINYQTGGGRVG